jgi:hypothetical protein
MMALLPSYLGCSGNVPSTFCSIANSFCLGHAPEQRRFSVDLIHSIPACNTRPSFRRFNSTGQHLDPVWNDEGLNQSNYAMSMSSSFTKFNPAHTRYLLC